MDGFENRIRPDELAAVLAVVTKRTSMEFDIKVSHSYLTSKIEIVLKKFKLCNVGMLLSRLDCVLSGHDIWYHLVDAASVHETDFNRHAEINEILKCYIRENKGRQFSIWSSSCSTGQEVYSVAATMKLNGIDDFIVHGSDISGQCLCSAMNGTYENCENFLVVFLSQCKLGERKRSICSVLKEKTNFFLFNIASDQNVDIPPVDIILCLNTLIYYCDKTRVKIAVKLARKLKPGGLLLLGYNDLVRLDIKNMEASRNGYVVIYRKDFLK
ncbi:MAG: CheR family methyltransferase [Pseudomonadales bacterium]